MKPVSVIVRDGFLFGSLPVRQYFTGKPFPQAWSCNVSEALTRETREEAEKVAKFVTPSRVVTIAVQN